MSKYHALRDFLLQSKKERLDMSFSEIEEILGFPLPKSAYEYSAWWANEAEGQHVQKQGWMDAGYETSDLKLMQKQVTFIEASRQADNKS